MNARRDYRGIDIFRVAAALLVITLHTSPLTSFSTTADFALTRIAARLAVPFFFMSSGFFTVSRYTKDTSRFKTFAAATLKTYAFAILLYIPLNIYNGYFSGVSLLPEILRDLIFDGTFYHLWFLPASVLGAYIAQLFIKKIGYKGAGAVTAALYLIGVFGDSWYGLAEKLPGIGAFYGHIFQIADYTRNGLFFSPLFIVLGGYMADSNLQISLKRSVVGFSVSFLAMSIEAFTLHRFGVPRFDAMYLMLPLCVLFLFNMLLKVGGKRSRLLRDVSLVIYIVHPWAIVAIRFAARLTHTQQVFVENSLGHFFAVTSISLMIGILASAAFKKMRKKERSAPRAYREIDFCALRHNLEVLRGLMPQKSEIMAVVKANAYGHGAFETATFLEKHGVHAFAVATADEGIELRKYGIIGDILVLGHTDPSRARELKKYRLIQTAVSYPYAEMLNEQGVRLRVHIKLDTGMHRLGIPWEEPERVRDVFMMNNLVVDGLYTHLSRADITKYEDTVFTKEQISRFYGVVECLKTKGITIPKLHIQSSYGLLNYPGLECDYVRAGIALYGAIDPANVRSAPDLRPVLTLKAQIALIREVAKGETVGYGCAFTAERDTLVAILQIGYADGVSRNLSNRGEVVINGMIAPIIGLVCMDQLAVDITDIGGASVGDMAEIIGGTISVCETARSAGSISNEMLSRLGTRVPITVL